MKSRHVAALALTVFVITLVLWPHGPEAGDEDLWDARYTTYSAGPRGVLAFYLLLEELGGQVSRWSAPSYKHMPPQSVLWLLGEKPLGRRERLETMSFIQGGGTLVAAPRLLANLTEDADFGEAMGKNAAVVNEVTGLHLGDTNTVTSLDLPTAPNEVFVYGGDGAPVVAAWNVGAGRLVALGVAEFVVNERIGRDDAGLFLARLASHLGPRHIFEEARQGFGAASLMELLKRVPYRALLAQLAVVLGVVLLMVIPRRWPVRTLSALHRRRVADHVEAVARLWERAENPSLPLSALMTALDVAARARLITPNGEEHAFVGWVSTRRPEWRQRVEALWEEGERLCAAPKHRTSESVREVAAQLIHMERTTQLWSRTPSHKR